MTVGGAVDAVRGLELRYRARTSRSEQLMVRARAVLPGGNTRTATHYDPYPTVFSSGSGYELRDVDDNTYVDGFFSGTSLVHGHAFPPVSEAVRRAAEGGAGWFGPSTTQIEFAEAICDRVRSIERVRFCSSGTEAALLAIKLARQYTGRPKVLKAIGGYHGFTAELESDPIMNSAAGTFTAEFNDAASFEAVLAEHGASIAAVILEPVVGVGGVVAAKHEFLERVARSAAAAGCVFVLDEVISFRLGVGGAQSRCGVEPDLTTLGKAIGGGLPIGAVGGRTELMALLDPTIPGGIKHAGSFNGNRLSCAAGLATLGSLTTAAIADMDRMAESLAARLCQAARAAGVPFAARREGSLIALFLRDDPPETPVVAHPDAPLLALFHLACMNRGIALGPRGILAIPTVADERYLEAMSDRAALAFADLTQCTA